MKKHNAIKEARNGWENFTKFMTWSSVISFVVIGLVVFVISY